MFDGTERQNILDLLRPPLGYRLESAVGTTYSLDFVALTASLMALVDAEQEDDTGSHVDSLHAITRLSDRVRVFANRAQIAGPRQVSRITVLYDRIVQDVRFARGRFHPKVWLLYYRARNSQDAVGQPSLVRVICSSRNLTVTRNWEAFVAFDGTEGPRKVTAPLNDQVTAFLGILVPTSARQDRPYRQLREALSRTTFELPRPLHQDAAFLWQWPGGRGLKEHLPAAGKRALVVSPFVRKGFLEAILDRFEQVTVISTQTDLDAIKDEQLIARLCIGKNRMFVVLPEDTDDGDGTAMGLHAKLLVCEGTHGPETYLGSANASSSAWDPGNCEAILRFTPGVSIDHFCDRFVFREESGVTGGGRPLRAWIAEYQRESHVEDERERAERRLEEIRVAIGQLSLQIRYDSKRRYLTLVAEPIPLGLVASYRGWKSSWEVQIALLSKLETAAALHPFDDLLSGGVVFPDVEPIDITEFIVVQVSNRHLELSLRFVLKAVADLGQWRDERDAGILQKLLNRERIQEFLKAILFDAAVRPAIDTGVRSGGKGRVNAPIGVLSELCIEDVLRSCTEDSSRIEEINRLLKACEGTELIDDEFRRFWATFVAAEREARSGSDDG